MSHEDILDRIQDIEIFFNYLGLEKTHDFPKDWNLDSNITYQPKDYNFLINYNNETRVLISVDINIMSGIEFTLSGKYKPEVAVYEKIQTDYYFKNKYSDNRIFQNEFRDYQLNQLIKNEINRGDKTTSRKNISL